MDWQPAPTEGLFVAQSFAFSGGERMDVRLAYRTLGTLAPDRGNAALLLHGTTGSGRQFLQPAFAGAMFGPGGPLDARSHFVILPDALGHGGSSKPSDGLERSFPCYGCADMVAAQALLASCTEGFGQPADAMVFHAKQAPESTAPSNTSAARTSSMPVFGQFRDPLTETAYGEPSAWLRPPRHARLAAANRTHLRASHYTSRRR